MIRRIITGIDNRARLYFTAFTSVVPKLIFGNTIGFKHNLVPKYQLYKLRKEHQLNIDLPNEILAKSANLSDYGFVELKGALGIEEVRQVKSKYVSMIEDDTWSVSSTNGFTRFMKDPINQIPEISNFLTKDLSDIIKSYYKTFFRIQSVRAWRNYHVPGYDPNTMDAFSNTFHNDDLPVTGLRVFILLSDNVTRETGATRLIDKKRSQKIVRSMKYFHRFKLSKGSIKGLNDPSKLIHFEGGLGDVCICNTQVCLHAASIPKEGTYRDILQFEVYPAPGPLSDNRTIFSEVPVDKEVAILS